MDQKDKRNPTLIIECQDETSIKIYEQLSERYITELIEEFREGKKVGIIRGV